MTDSPRCTCSSGGHPVLCSDPEHVELFGKYVRMMSERETTQAAAEAAIQDHAEGEYLMDWMDWTDSPNSHRDLVHGDYRAKVCPNGDRYNVTAWYRDDDFYHDWAFYQANAERHAEDEIRRHEGMREG